MGFWEEEAYTRKDENGNLVSLEEYEARQKKTWFMTKGDVKLYLICGVGFFIDAYDLFIVNLAQPIWAIEYWHPSSTYPPLLRGAVNAAANIGNIVGQISFGIMGDAFGRKFVYGKELIIAMIGIIFVISLPNHHFTSHGKMWWLFGFRLLMGIGIGGDYPMSAAIVAERSTLNNRGRMLGWIFSNQGWGTLFASLITLILYGIFKDPLSHGDLGKLDGVWRLQIGLIFVPCFITLYWRLTMPDSRKYLQSQELTAVNNSSLMNSQSSLESVEKDAGITTDAKLANLPEHERRVSVIEAHAVAPDSSSKLRVFVQYFSEWRHLKTLIGTASTWFLVDVSFYGTNLNTQPLLQAFGFVTSSGTQYHRLLRATYGNLIIVVAGYLPGYFFTIATIEWLGRKPIQTGGFLLTALFFGIIAGYRDMSVGGKFACFTLAQLFFNFGPNATTFIVPAEAFPSRVRGFAHGLSAAIGKLGAILAGILFNYLSAPSRLDTWRVLWIFFGINILGAICTVLFVPETKGVDADAVDYEETQAAVARRGV